MHIISDFFIRLLDLIKVKRCAKCERFFVGRSIVLIIDNYLIGSVCAKCAKKFK
jgi:hypothetical protein